MADSHVNEVPVGSRLGPFKIIRQHVVDDSAQDAFELELPGKVNRVAGKTAFLSILPYGRLVLTDGEVPRAATISAAVVDDAGLDTALTGLHKLANSVEGFAIRLATSGRSYSDLLDAAETVSSGHACCDECGGGVATVFGSIRVGVKAVGDNDFHWSTPIRAAIKAWAGDDDNYRPFNPKDDSTASDDDYCDSEWWCDWWYRNKETTCHGSSCTAPEICACLKDARGRTHNACKGWSFCWCM